MFKFFKSPFFDFEYLKILGAAPFQGSEICEVLEARTSLKENDPEAWYATWYDRGEKAIAIGEEALSHGDRVAARWAFLRAANYYRASELMIHVQPSDPRLYDAIKRSSDAHDRAMTFMDTDVIKLRIPYDNGVELPARLYMPAPEHRVMGRIPLILQTGGFDTTAEELYYYGAAGAVPRGYAVLTFDGPGQGLSLRKDRTTLRYDWEYVCSKVLDYIFDTLVPENEYLELDLDCIAVMGSTMGGYFALRAATDPRVKAVVSVDGFYSLFDVVKSRMPGFLMNGWMAGTISDNMFNSIMRFVSRFDFQLSWDIANSYWVYGVGTPCDVIRMIQKMSLVGPDGQSILSKVNCPVLVMGGEQAHQLQPELNQKRMMEDLEHLDPSKKQLWVGDGVSNGGTQSKIGDLSMCHQQMFEFLDRQFGIKRFVPLKRQ